MLVQEAVECLADGHSIIPVASAREICTTLNISFSEELVMTWENRQDAWNRYGFVATKAGADSGVGSLELSYHVAEKLGLGKPGSRFSGKGFQAQANSRAIAQKLQKPESSEETSTGGESHVV